MASEDSDQVVPGLLAIHGLSDLRDLNEPIGAQMSTRRHHLDAARKLLKVTLLRCTHRISPEERYYRLEEVRASLDQVVAEVFSMVVVALVHEYAPHSEEALQLFQAGHTPCALRHDETVRHLIASSVALPTHPVWLPDEAD